MKEASRTRRLRLLRAAQRRTVVGSLLAAFLWLALASGTLAKMPYFTVETSPADPPPNEPILLVARTWANAEHTVPGASEEWSRAFSAAVTELNDLLVVRGAGSPDIPVHLTQVDVDRFEGTITLPAGDWTLVAFPVRAGWPSSEVPAGYPDKIRLVVREPGGLPSALVLGIPMVIGVALLLGRRLGWRMTRGTRPSPRGRAYPPTP